MNVCVYGNTVLEKIAKPIVQFDTTLEVLSKTMLETMYKAEGIGLAAPQIGQSVRLVVIDLQDATPKDEVILNEKKIPTALLFPLVIVNPTLTPMGKEEDIMEEGCLSLPNVRGNVKRFSSIQARYQDIYGAWHELQCSGLLARCFQHEVDHLNGVLFIKHLLAAELEPQKELLENIKKATTVTDIKIA